MKIKLVEKQPPTTWNIANSHEYGFYSNVNPDVDHPRWSQAKEQRRSGRVRQAHDPDVQRLRRPGRQPLRRHGSEEKLLNAMLQQPLDQGPGLLCCAWLPALLWLVWRVWHDGPHGRIRIEFITHFTGDWTLRFLLITLAITPLRKLLNQPDLIRFRRMLGLFAFFYGCLHFLTYLWLDKFFDCATRS